MLSRIFNWIKFKTLPPSVNFKNRLFIERDNKDRRTVAGLGSVFRNSKWTPYQRSNLSFTTLSNFQITIRNIALLIVAFLFTISANKYLGFFSTNSNFFTTVWFFLDSTLNLILSASLLILLNLHTAVTSLIRRYYNSPNTDQQSTDHALSNFLTPHQLLDKRVEKKLLYQWGLLGYETNAIQLTSLFDAGKINTSADKFTLYQSLFKLLTVIGVEPKTLPTAVQSDSITIKPLKLLSDSSYYTLNIDYMLAQSPSSCTNNKCCTWSLNSLNRWSFWTITNSSLTNILIDLPRGVFFETSSDFSSVNFKNTTSSIQLSTQPLLKDQTDWVKLSRWLSKYTILHRHMVMNSHKSTLTKRLIQSGFYNSDLDKANNTISSFKAVGTEGTPLLKDLYSKGYFNFFSNSALTKLSSVPQNRWSYLSSPYFLSLNEDSFFWVTKRFYYYNNLSANIREDQLITHSLPKTLMKGVNPDNQLMNFKLLQKNYVLDAFPFKSNTESSSSRTSSTKTSLLSLLTFNDNQTDLFDYDFTESAILLLQNPEHKSTKTTYYSSLNHTLTIDSSNLAVKKFKI